MNPGLSDLARGWIEKHAAQEGTDIALDGDDEPIECIYCQQVIEDWYEEEAFWLREGEAAHHRCHEIHNDPEFRVVD